METRSLKKQALRRLEALEFSHISAYQPEHLFVKNGRKLSRVAEPCDPWLVSATHGDRTYREVGSCPMIAVSAIIHHATMPALHALGVEIESLTGALRGRG